MNGDMTKVQDWNCIMAILVAIYSTISYHCLFVSKQEHHRTKRIYVCKCEAFSRLVFDLLMICWG